MDLAKWEPLGGLIRWKPTFCGLDEVTGNVARMFAHRNLAGRSEVRRILGSIGWIPDVDIEERENEYLIRAEIPEVRKEDVKVTIVDGILTLEGERLREEEDDGVRFRRTERSYGNFLRRFSLPGDADGAKVAADLKDGVLHVHLPKSKTLQSRAIEVSVD
jgi:HSP20 family protein